MFPTTLNQRLLKLRPPSKIPFRWLNGWAQKGESSSYAVVYQTPEADTQFCGYAAPNSHLTDSADLALVDVNCNVAGLFHTPELYSFTTLTDKIALTDLYAALGGPNWTEHTGWLRDEFHCAWQGVLCDSDGFVSALWLDENNLLGTVPDAVGRLRHLRSLDLSGNALSGGLPANLSQLVNLSQLFLGNAGLSGTLESSFGDMRQLTYLDMSGNQISGNLATFSGLENLRFMSLADNAFTGNFPSNGAWPLLEHLNLSGNAVSGALPPDVNTLAKLRYLDLSENAFSGNLPIGLEYLTSLETIDLSENALDGPIGESLGAFLAARDPVLVGNDFNCPYPSALVDYFTAEEEQCVPPDPPATPIVVKTDYGDGEVVLHVAVAADGGAAIATYDAFCSNGEQVFTGSSTTTRILVSGLTNGVTYTCTVTATNSVGTSSASAASAPITPEATSTGLPIWLLYQATQ